MVKNLFHTHTMSLQETLMNKPAVYRNITQEISEEKRSKHLRLEQREELL